MAWTDERLDDLAARMDAGFAEVKAEIRDLRNELKGDMHSLRAELKGDTKALRTEIKGDIDALRAEVKTDIEGLRTVMMRFGIAIMICLAGVIATLIGVIATGSVSG